MAKAQPIPIPVDVAVDSVLIFLCLSFKSQRWDDEVAAPCWQIGRNCSLPAFAPGRCSHSIFNRGPSDCALIFSCKNLGGARKDPISFPFRRGMPRPSVLPKFAGLSRLSRSAHYIRGLPFAPPPHCLAASMDDLCI